MTGTTIAQAIPIAISPILTRLYTPKDFGVLALYLSLCTILGTVANARYELAIMLPASDEDAVNIAALGLGVTLVLSLVLFLTALLAGNDIASALGNSDIKNWLYFVPLTVFLIGLFNTLNYLNNRMKQYAALAKAGVYKSLTAAIAQLAAGFARAGAGGLIVGQILSNVTANGRLIKNILAAVDVRESLSWHSMKAMAFRYKNFQFYSLPAVLSNALGSNFINILISSYYSIATLGLYSLGQRMLGMPSSLLGGSVAQVFFRHAVEERRLTGRANRTFNSTVKKLLVISIPGFTLAYFFSEPLFALMFGEKWRAAGVYVRLLVPLFFIRFIASSVSSIFDVFEALRLELVWQVGFLLLSVGIILLCHVYDIDFIKFLKINTVVLSVWYIVYFLMMLYVVRGKPSSRKY